MVDLTEGARPVPVDHELRARRIWGEDAVFCLGDNPDWGSDQHVPSWHHRAYHAQRMQPRWTIAFDWRDMWVGVFYARRSRVVFICPLPCLLITYRRRPR